MLIAAGASALAAPLQRDECERLDKERERLEQAGVRIDLAKGPAEAKSRLASDRLQSIATLIEIDEKLLFRCPGFRSLVTLREDPPDPPDPSDTLETKPGTGDRGAAKGPAKPKPEAAPKSGPKSEPRTAPRAKPKPKPKADDAKVPAPEPLAPG